MNVYQVRNWSNEERLVTAEKVFIEEGGTLGFYDEGGALLRAYAHGGWQDVQRIGKEHEDGLEHTLREFVRSLSHIKEGSREGV